MATTLRACTRLAVAVAARSRLVSGSAMRAFSAAGGRAPPPGARPGVPSGAAASSKPAGPPPGVLIDANGNAIRAPASPAGSAAPARAAGGPASSRAPASTAPGAPLPDSDLIFEATEASFATLVLQSPVPVLLDCYATWCEPCKKLTPTLEAITRAAGGALRLVKLDTDAQPGLAGQLGVKSLPTVIGVVGGKLVDSFTGLVPQPELQRFLNAMLQAGQAAGQLAANGRPVVDVRGSGGGAPAPSPEAMLGEVHAMLEVGDFASALTVLPPLLDSLLSIHARMRVGDAPSTPSPAAASKASGALASGPLAQVEQLLARTYGMMTRAMLAAGQNVGKAGGPAEEAQSYLSQAQVYADTLRSSYSTYLKHADVSRALAAADLVKGAAQSASKLTPLEDAVRASPENVTALVALAEAQVATGLHSDGIQTALKVLTLHTKAGAAAGEASATAFAAARALLLKTFETLGAGDPLVLTGRKAMSKALFR